MEIKGVQETSLIDWPGKIASVIFFNRCNFRCGYCHNPELAVGMANTPNIPPTYVLSQLYSKKKWINGVVLSGGEPTLNKGIIEFCRDIQNYLKVGIKVDTNGSNPKLLKILLEEQLIDKVSLDVKAPLDNDEVYKRVCKAQIDARLIEQSVNLICDSGIDCEFRTTVVPCLLSEEDILEIVCELSCICGGKIKEYTIQNFNSKNPVLDSTLQDKENYSFEVLENLRHKILTKHNVLTCRIK